MTKGKAATLLAIMALLGAAVLLKTRGSDAARNRASQTPSSPAEGGASEPPPSERPQGTKSPSAALLATREEARRSQDYSRLSPQDLREETFWLCDQYRIAMAGKDPKALDDVRRHLKAMGDRAWPFLLEEIRLCQGESDSIQAALHATRAAGLRDRAELAAALRESAPEGSAGRILGAWVLVNAGGSSEELAPHLRQLVQEEVSLKITDPAQPLEVRAQAAQVYGALAGRAAEPTLARCLGEANEYGVRYSILLSIARMGATVGSAEALRHVAQNDSDASLRALASQILKRAGLGN